MKISRITLLISAASTLGTYGALQLIRLATGIFVARLVTPELLGIMVIVYILRYGAEQLSDIGIGQSMVTNVNAEKPDFYNTAWSLHLIRGVILSIVFLVAAIPLSYAYAAPIFTAILPVVSIYFVLAGLTSMSPYLLTKRMKITKLNASELLFESISSISRIAVIYVSPTIWGLVLGSFAQPLVRVVGSHFLIPGMRHKFFISREFAWQIFHFGKWIFLAAVLFFLLIELRPTLPRKNNPFCDFGSFQHREKPFRDDWRSGWQTLQNPNLSINGVCL